MAAYVDTQDVLLLCMMGFVMIGGERFVIWQSVTWNRHQAFEF